MPRIVYNWPVTAEIVPFEPAHAHAFYALNRAWLDAHGLYEPADEHHLAHPERSILAEGGSIFIAVTEGEVIGTAAVVPIDERVVEIVKLTVASHARGQGLGRRLVNACVQRARDAGAERIALVSSSLLHDALALYESMGFEHRPMPSRVPYATADVYMELALGDAVRA